MPKIEPEAPLAGAAALHSLLTLLQDPQAHAAKLKALEDKQAAINAAVERAGQADAIPKLLEQAQQDRAAAAELLNGARRDADNTRKQAIADRDAAREDAKMERQAAAQAKASREALERTAEQRFSQRERDLADRERETERLHELALQDRAEAEALKKEWEEKVAKLRGAMV